MRENHYTQRDILGESIAIVWLVYSIGGHIMPKGVYVTESACLR